MAVTDTKSREWFEHALACMPGGVSSPVRAFRAVDGVPRFIASARGARFTDVDGNEFLDFVQSWGPLILGHAEPSVVAAVAEAAQRGLTYGAPHETEVALARRVCESYPGVERVRFTSSGTEATMSAIRLARGATGRSRIVKFDGCYHGHSDGLLVAAGSGAVTFGEPSSAGVPAEIAALTSVLPLDDDAALERLFAEHGSEIATVILEPIPANNGLLVQRREYLERLRELTKEHGALLIFDEVISGFRVARGGAAALYGIEPDLVTFGKILGGGMPCGAFAGSAEWFEHLAPLGPVYQAGTLSGNPLAMAAGLRTLERCDELDAWAKLESRTSAFVDSVVRRIRARDYPVAVQRVGSVFWFAFGSCDLPRKASEIPSNAAELYRTFHSASLARGVYFAPSAYEVGFVSTAHTSDDLAQAADAVVDALEETFA